MSENQILEFAGDAAANVQTYATYLADLQRIVGNQRGTVIRSSFVNKNLQQITKMAVVLAQFIVDQSGNSVLDSDSVSTIESNLIRAIRDTEVYTTTTGSDNAYVLTLFPSLSNYNGSLIIFKANFTNTGEATMDINEIGAVALKKNVTDALVAGDIIENKIYIGFYDGTNIQILNPSAQTSIYNSINDFRLTLTSGTPVTTIDVTGASTIYCTPYSGNKISLYDGTKWETLTSAEFPKALGTLTASLPYDAFCYNDAGTPTLEYLAWTNGTTRATALAYQDGILVKSGDATRRYMGTFYTSSTTTTEDSAAKRYLENYYNAVDRTLSGTFSTDRTTSSATYVELNSEIQIKFIVGNNDNPVRLQVNGSAAVDNNTAHTTGVAIDSTTNATPGLEVSGSTSGSTYSPVPISISNSINLGIGHHYATLLGMTASNAGKWFSSSANNKSKVFLSAVKKG